MELPMLTNFHILKVEYLGATNSRDSRVKIISERFKQSLSFSFDSEYNSTKEQAQAFLTKAGFKLIGSAEGKNCYYLISSTFKPIK